MDFIGYGIPVILILVGLIVGTASERSHLRNLQVREDATADVLVTQIKTFPHLVPGNTPPTMVIGEVVIATDYLKSFLAKMRNIFGGEIGSYLSLLQRARREALLRAVEEARAQGYNAVCNVRYQTADVGGNSTRRKVAMVAILASGTAYHAARPGT